MKKFCLIFLLILFSTSVSAKSRFDEATIKGELRKPGVKLVAIDFYMTGCEPCDAAIPEWKKLKEDYGDSMKLIVVAPQRDDGSCSVKGWHPDKIVCDEDMEIASAWGVKDFPQAFLYSWHNNDPLVKLGHVKDVRKAIKKYFKTIPRVALDADEESGDLLPMVEEALITNSKIEVVADEDEREELMEIRKESHKLRYDEDSRCELGKEIAANSILKITKQDETLSLKLSSAEKSCTMAAATKILSGNKGKLKTEIASAVYDLLSQMFGDITTPGDSAKAVAVQEYNPVHDGQHCMQTRLKSTISDWQEYLKTYPQGTCSKEAKTNIKNLKNKPSYWSKRAPKKMSWEKAEKYCKDLVEDDYDDWRLPNISEFREIALDCPSIEPKGDCQIRKDNRSATKWNAEECSCTPGAHSRLGDSDSLWSATEPPMTFGRFKWIFDSSGGAMSGGGISVITPNISLAVRCISDKAKKAEAKKKKK